MPLAPDGEQATLPEQIVRRAWRTGTPLEVLAAQEARARRAGGAKVPADIERELVATLRRVALHIRRQ